MTIEEMRKRIKKECSNHKLCNGCPLYNETENCWNDIMTDEEIKENYKLMFGKEKSKMKNEFNFNELKAGYAIKVPAYGDELIIGIPYGENEIIFCSKEFNKVIRKEEITTDFALKEYMPIEVYRLSSSDELFDPRTRPLLWKKEDINQKKYEIGDLKIYPNFREGYIGEDEDDEGIIYIEENRGDKNYPDDITIKKSELNDVINALTEIRDFINEDE